MLGNIDENKPQVEFYEVGIYVNFYRILSDWNNISMGSKYYESPSEARKGIIWDQEGYTYLFTAKITDTVFKYER